MKYESDELMVTQPRREVEDPAGQYFHSGSGIYATGGRAPVSLNAPLGQNYVHPGEGRPLPSKDARRDSQQKLGVPVAIRESAVSPKIGLPEPVSSTSSLNRKTSSWGNGAGGDSNCRHTRLGKYVPRQSSFYYYLSPQVWEALRRGKSGHCRWKTPTPIQNRSYRNRPSWEG